eukprot:scaffold651_cov252-Pinguiococcus_pyrenoidosus.AAC.4
MSALPLHLGSPHLRNSTSTAIMIPSCKDRPNAKNEPGGRLLGWGSSKQMVVLAFAASKKRGDGKCKENSDRAACETSLHSIGRGGGGRSGSVAVAGGWLRGWKPVDDAA